jgi:hypothetical protein
MAGPRAEGLDSAARDTDPAAGNDVKGRLQVRIVALWMRVSKAIGCAAESSSLMLRKKPDFGVALHRAVAAAYYMSASFHEIRAP